MLSLKLSFSFFWFLFLLPLLSLSCKNYRLRYKLISLNQPFSSPILKFYTKVFVFPFSLDLQPLNTDSPRSIANKDVRYVKAGITENAILILYLSASEKEIFTDIVSDTILHMNY